MNLTTSLIPHMVTINEAAKATGVSAYTVRQLVKQNQIVHIKAGIKYLVNLDRFIEYLNGQK